MFISQLKRKSGKELRGRFSARLLVGGEKNDHRSTCMCSLSKSLGKHDVRLTRAVGGAVKPRLEPVVTPFRLSPEATHMGASLLSMADIFFEALAFRSECDKVVLVGAGGQHRSASSRRGSVFLKPAAQRHPHRKYLSEIHAQIGSQNYLCSPSRISFKYLVPTSEQHVGCDHAVNGAIRGGIGNCAASVTALRILMLPERIVDINV